jgi:hypothetical protein
MADSYIILSGKFVPDGNPPLKSIPIFSSPVTLLIGYHLKRPGPDHPDSFQHPKQASALPLGTLCMGIAVAPCFQALLPVGRYSVKIYGNLLPDEMISSQDIRIPDGTFSTSKGSSQYSRYGSQ